jgi:hypothetical protein
MLYYSGYNCPKCDKSDVQFDTLSELRLHLNKCHCPSLTGDVHSATVEHASVRLNFLPAINESRFTGLTRGSGTSPSGMDHRIPAADAQLQSVLNQVWHQVNSANKTSAQNRELQKMELASLRNDVKSLKAELTAAEQEIKALTTERDQLASDCSTITQQVEDQKQMNENLHKQLADQNDVIVQKDE